jgi:hypothetical protein
VLHDLRVFKDGVASFYEINHSPGLENFLQEANLSIITL